MTPSAGTQIQNSGIDSEQAKTSSLKFMDLEERHHTVNCGPGKDFVPNTGELAVLIDNSSYEI